MLTLREKHAYEHEIAELKAALKSVKSELIAANRQVYRIKRLNKLAGK